MSAVPLTLGESTQAGASRVCSACESFRYGEKIVHGMYRVEELDI